MHSILSSRTLAGLAVAVSSIIGLTSCASELTRTGSSPAFVIIDSIVGASGAEPEEFGSPLASDVQTGGGTFNDLGRATLRLGLRNPGSATNPTAPSTLNTITLSRYRVEFRRSDGRNTQGVDVPYAFDGAATVTIPAQGSTEVIFEVVRNQAKLEAPLSNLRGLGGRLIISTIAEITFFGRDQVGNEVVATGTLSVNFADFADPEGGQ
ncbi:MAG: hypothetical protein IT177_06160 [Acidobacteria bacterium]|nr:hypothetical protein [Acidobacteriota bacterium]